MKRAIPAYAAALVLFMCAVAPAEPSAPAFPAPGAWRFGFKPEVSYISYFLKGNVHDTLGHVRSMRGGATATVTPEGRLADPAVQFTFAADTMDSKDAARDERMKKKFMETALYPEISFRSTGSGASLKQAAPVAQATKERPVAFDLEGALKIHGTERQVTIPVTTYPEGGCLVVEGETVLALKSYNIANPSFFIFRTDDNVKINFHFELQPAAGAKP